MSEFPQHFIMSMMFWLFLYKFKAMIQTVSGTTGHFIVFGFQICLALKFNESFGQFTKKFGVAVILLHATLTSYYHISYSW